MRTLRTKAASAFVAALLVQGCLGGPGGGLSDDGYRDYPEVHDYPDRPLYDGPYGYYDDDDEREWARREHRRYGCAEIGDRIRYDREKIRTIDPSKHHKALQWYKDDLRNAERDRDRCRAEIESRHQRRQVEERQQRRGECRKIRDRIRFDQQKIATTDPSKHHKALQWYKDDLRNAERDLQNCRSR
jgi:hypothetical protein